MCMNQNESTSCPAIRQHNHEVLGSVEVEGCCQYAHNHRFATVSGEAIPREGSHVHEIKFTTDTCDGHHHEFCGTSGPAIRVGGGHHVHFAESVTSVNDGHRHKFAVAALIESPACEED